MNSNRKKIVVAHSPDADDAFMFYGLSTGKIRSPTLEFEHVLQDIESLNNAAHEGRYEMTAISYHAYPYVADRYILTSAGSSIGDGYGPVVVSKRPLAPGELKGRRIAIPGKLTTAYLALRLFEPEFEEHVVNFDDIIAAVQREEADAGVLIHEGQLQVSQSGLCKVVDLGAWWKQEQGLPLPLGANAILRSLPPEIQAECGLRLRETIQYALDHREDAIAHALQFGRGIDSTMADRFIGMYVNHYTLAMAPEVVESAQRLLDRGYELGVVKQKAQIEYV